ncbi:acid-sensing ion channel 4-B-like, partial [Oculina patagonica]
MAFKELSVGMNNVSNLHDQGRNRNKDGESNTEHVEMEELKSFAQDTSLHGARLLIADNFFRRLFWTVAILACLCYCDYQVSTCVIEFYKRPFNTKITTHIISDSSNKLLFPAITLCNLNAINARRFRQIRLSGPSKRNAIERQLKDISLLIARSKEVSKEDFKKRNPELFLRQKTTNITHKFQGLFSHQLEEMLLTGSPQFESCSINGKHCDANNFTSYQNQKTFPIVEEFGIKLQPGVSTLCAVKRRK